MAKAESVSSRVAGSRSLKIRSATGICWRNEKPRSRVAMPLTYSEQLHRQWLVEAEAFAELGDEDLVGDAPASPAITRAGSPGAARIRKKFSTTMASSDHDHLDQTLDDRKDAGPSRPDSPRLLVDPGVAEAVVHPDRRGHRDP